MQKYEKLEKIGEGLYIYSYLQVLTLPTPILVSVLLFHFHGVNRALTETRRSQSHNLKTLSYGIFQVLSSTLGTKCLSNIR